MIVYALGTDPDVGFRLVTLGLGVGSLAGGLVLHRATEIALKKDGGHVTLNAADGGHAAALGGLAEIATKELPDDLPDKPRIVQNFAVEGVHALNIASSLAGTWWAVMEAHKDRPRKIDVVEATVAGEDVTATIGRISPPEQTGRRWEFVGKVRGGYLFAMFYTTTPDLTAMSYGTIQLRRDDGAGTLWKGFYVRLKVTSHSARPQDELERINMCWQRSRPSDLEAPGRADAS